jgi:hypothetical protein
MTGSTPRTEWNALQWRRDLYLPEVVGHVLLGEVGVGWECEVDLQRGGAVDEVVAAHPRRARGEPARVLAAQRHGRRQPETSIQN